MTTVGFVGLGSMGAPIAGRLLQGSTVYGTNRTKAKAAELIERGLIWRDTPREVAQAAQVVFSMVTDDAALAAITSGRDGILAGLRPESVYVEMSTVSPQASRELAGQVCSAGASMIDAPVSGSVPAAGNGTLSIMVGGPEAAFLAAEPLLRQLGRSVTHVGGNGQGLLTSGLVLAVMILPIIAATARDLIRGVPLLPREGAIALGMSDWECARKVTLPWVGTGLIGAIFLGLGRAVGETIAVAMVCGVALGSLPTNLYAAMITISASRRVSTAALILPTISALGMTSLPS